MRSHEGSAEQDKRTVAIDQVGASSVLSQYVAEVVHKALGRMQSGKSELPNQVELVNQMVCKYIEEHCPQDQITLITSDVFPKLSDFMRRELVKATIYQDPFHQGYKAFENLYLNPAEGKEYPSVLMARPQIVFKSDLLYQNRLDTFGYNDELFFYCCNRLHFESFCAILFYHG